MYKSNYHTLSKRGYTTLLALLVSIITFAQNVTIKGVIFDETNLPLIGATVQVKGGQAGAATDLDGKYSIQAPKNGTLVISYIGYKTQEIKIQGKTSINVTLMPDNQTLDEVVVVGYGTMKKSDLTGSVASVSQKNVEGFKTSSVMEALGGQIAGVQITQNDGTPGSGFNVNIRGVGTLTGDASPLYIVDGFEVSGIDHLANSDIESIEILKDASASAIYGARAANGVVLVTTRSGKTGKPVIVYNGSASYRNISKKLDMLSPYEFVKLQVELNKKYTDGYYREGVDKDGNPYPYQTLDDYLTEGGVRWQDETFNPTWSQDHNVTITGGTNDTKYSASFSHYDENGIFTNSGFQKTTGKFRVNQKLTKSLTLDATFNYSNIIREGVGTTADSGRFNMLAMILRARPTGGNSMTNEELLNSAIDVIELTEGDGSLAQVNPIKQAESVNNKRNAEMWGTNMSLTYKITKDLTFKTAATYNTTNTRADIFYTQESREAYRSGGNPYGQTQMTKDVRFVNYNNLTYRKKFNKKNTLDVMLGHEYSYRGSEYLLGQAKDFPFDNLGNDNLGLGATPSQVRTYKSEKRSLSFFARGTYNYDNRYLLTATVRADGSTVFSKKNKWGYFPSVALAWNVVEERFMKNQKIFDQLKLRASFGVSGNSDIGSYSTLGTLSEKNYDSWGSGQIWNGYWSGSLSTPDVTWESTYQYNVGVDVSVLSGRLNFTAEWFRKDTKDLLLRKPIPSYNGGGSFWVNNGEIRNRGVEFNLAATPVATKNLRWETSFNASWLHNEVIDLAGDPFIVGENLTGFGAGPIEIKKVGHPIGSFYVYEWQNFSKDGLNLYKHQADGSFTTTPTSDDLVVKGQAEPSWTFGWNNTVTWKNWTFNCFFNAALGSDRLNMSRFAMSSMVGKYKFITFADAYYKSWDMVENKMEALYSTHKNSENKDFPDSDFYLEDASYIKLKNISIAYTVPRKWARIADLQLSVSAQNVFTLTHYSGMDPEVINAGPYGLNGVDMGAYPIPRTFTFGLKLNF